MPELEQFRLFIVDNQIPENELKKISKFVNRIRLERFKKNSMEYRGVDRTFKDHEIQTFFNLVDNLKFKIIFLLLAYLGLRIGEAVQLKLEDLDLEHGYIKIKTEKQKSNIIDLQPIPAFLIPIIKLYTQKYAKRIEMRNNWLFPQKIHSLNHVIEADVRRKFYQYRNACGLNISYAQANDLNNPIHKTQGSRNLHNRTLHSFRHWYKIKLDKAGLPYGLIKVLMRHKGGSVTESYGQYGFEEKKNAVNEVFKGL